MSERTNGLAENKSVGKSPEMAISLGNDGGSLSK
jgi:hypothetical protein